MSTLNLINQRNVSHIKLSKYCDIDARLYGGYFFYVGSHFSPRGGHAIFSVCGGVSFSAWGGIIGLARPHNNFCFCGSLLLSQIFLTFPDRGGLNFFEGVIRSTQKTSPPAAPAPITINNLCPPRPSTNYNK